LPRSVDSHELCVIADVLEATRRRTSAWSRRSAIFL
jgi:hypothetical protein